jgi:hypothetical protein
MLNTCGALGPENSAVPIFTKLKFIYSHSPFYTKRCVFLCLSGASQWPAPIRFMPSAALPLFLRPPPRRFTACRVIGPLGRSGYLRDLQSPRQRRYLVPARRTGSSLSLPVRRSHESGPGAAHGLQCRDHCWPAGLQPGRNSLGPDGSRPPSHGRRPPGARWAASRGAAALV